MTVDRLLGSRWTKFLFALSAAVFTGVQITIADSSIGMIAVAVINIIIVFSLVYYLSTGKHKILNRLFKIKIGKSAIVSLLISVYSMWKITQGFHANVLYSLTNMVNESMAEQFRNLLAKIGLLYYVVILVAAVAALPFAFAVTYAIVSRLRRQMVIDLWNSMNMVERVYFISAILSLGCLITFVYCFSTFSYIGIDIVYNFDSEIQVFYGYNLYWGSGQSINRMLHTLLSSPITFIANAADDVLFFVQFPTFHYVVQLCSTALIVAGGILLSRLCNMRGVAKALFLLCYTVQYSVLVFSILIEAYVIPTVCVILLIYIRANRVNGEFIAAQAAAGALITSSVFFPFLSYDKSLKIWLTNLMKYLLAFVVICCCYGKMTVLVQAVKQVVDQLGLYAGEGLSKQAMQFLNFISSCFIKPDTVIGETTLNVAPPSDINRLGVIFFVLSIVGFIINRSNRFAQFSFFWVTFSFVILFVVGWQSAKNEMFLCSFYFGWAFFALVFMFFEKLFGLLPEKLKGIKYAAYSAAAAAMAFVNIREIAEIISFGIEYYPA